MVAVLAELEPRPLPSGSLRSVGPRRRSLLAAVDEYVAGPRIVPASPARPQTVVRPSVRFDTRSDVRSDVRPLPRPATVRPAPRPAAPAAITPDTLRQLFLWRRIAVGAVAVAVILFSIWGVSVLGGVSLVTSEHRSAPVTYTVQPGDSLWTVAQRVAPEDDPRRVVADLERARSGAPLIPGQTIMWTR